MLIHGLNKLTLLDFPGRVACLVFTGGCNFRCPFCQNAPLVLAPAKQPVIPEEEFFAFLKKRKGMLEGVVVTGGEPTLDPGLYRFFEQVREEGLLTKLDTNGTSPQTVRKLLDAHLLDYIAMDIKNSTEKYAHTVGVSDDGLKDAIEESICLIRDSGIEHEFRTTVVKELHTAEDIESIGKRIKGANAYYLQAFRDCDSLVGADEGTFHPPDKQTLREFADIARKYVGKVEIRGEG